MARSRVTVIFTFMLFCGRSAGAPPSAGISDGLLCGCSSAILVSGRLPDSIVSNSKNSPFLLEKWMKRQNRMQYEARICFSLVINAEGLLDLSGN
jgi:hypothetical protein